MSILLKQWMAGVAGNGQNWSSYWATQFATAAGITDTGQIAIVEDLCADFAAAGLWDKMKAIYPFIGGTAAAHKINLKDPRDADDAFRITWSGTVTHDGNGIKSNGSNGYGNTHLVPNTHLTYNNYHISVYCRDDSNADINGYELGTGAALIGIYRAGWVGGIFTCDDAFTPIALATINNTKGLFTATRVSSTNCRKIRNGTNLYQVTTEVADPNNAQPFFICAKNNAGSPQGYSPRQIGFICIGDGLTVYEEQLKYAIIRKYINAMDSHSAYNDQILFESWQPSSLDQVSLTLKINTGHKIYIDWGEDAAVEITGDGSDVTVTSDYGTVSKTYYGRIYGELTELIRFKVDTEVTLAALNVNDFRRLNVPLYDLFLKSVKSVILSTELLPAGLTTLTLSSIGDTNGYGSANVLPRYLQEFTISSACGLTMDNWTSLPSTITKLHITTWIKGDINIDNLPSGLLNLSLFYITGLSGSLKNLPSSMIFIWIEGSGTGVDITTAPFKPWATCNMTIISAYLTAAVDGFFNTYALVAADGAATLNLAGVGAGVANQADSAASADAQTALGLLSKTIQTN